MGTLEPPPVQKAAGSVKSTPRGVLGGCFKCGATRMRLCFCHENKQREIAMGRQCDLFSKTRNGMMSDNTVVGRCFSVTSGSGRSTPAPERLRAPRDGAIPSQRSLSSLGGSSVKDMPLRNSTPDLHNLEEKLNSLNTWYDKGIISEHEFRAERAKALANMPHVDQMKSLFASVSQNAQTLSAEPSSAPEFSISAKKSSPIVTKNGFGAGGPTISANMVPVSSPNHRGNIQNLPTVTKLKADVPKGNHDVHRSRKEEDHAYHSTNSSVSPRSSIIENKSNQYITVEWEDEDQMITKNRIDFLMGQLRMMCYRKVRGCGADVSIREIFRHFDSDKDDGHHGIAQDEWIPAVTKLMLGCAGHGVISVEEAKCMFRRMDANSNGTIDYRETAEHLSLPGWDHRYVGKKSNVLL